MTASLEKFLVLCLVALVSVFVTRWLSQRSGRMANTMEMFRYYHSGDLLNARNKAWSFLTGRYLENRLPFDQYFADSSDDHETYECMAKVIYFWMSLCVLKGKSEINEDVSKQLFSRQYRDWERAIKPLYEATKDNSDYRPDWFILFENRNMDWLTQPNR